MCISNSQIELPVHREMTTQTVKVSPCPSALNTILPYFSSHLPNHSFPVLVAGAFSSLDLLILARPFPYLPWESLSDLMVFNAIYMLKSPERRALV